MRRRTTAVLVATSVAAVTAGAAPATAHPTRPSAVRIHNTHNATQVITVTAGSYGSTRANVRAYAKRNGKWHLVYGPYKACIGYNGFAPPGDKREGDGRTPSGSYTFSYFFGDDAKPSGIHYKWKHATAHDYWDDDSSSSRYNEWVDANKHSAGHDPEPLYTLPSYADVGVINYNASRTPGRGSAIFLHVTHHSATSGCVALPRSDVLRLLRWLQPKEHARIIMGTTATVTS
jgi:L,D-peptidoglycan transpeptidase YkuD (ErfK/YbiS/YcfS/YnhG family)